MGRDGAFGTGGPAPRTSLAEALGELAVTLATRCALMRGVALHSLLSQRTASMIGGAVAKHGDCMMPVSETTMLGIATCNIFVAADASSSHDDSSKTSPDPKSASFDGFELREDISPSTDERSLTDDTVVGALFELRMQHT